MRLAAYSPAIKAAITYPVGACARKIQPAAAPPRGPKARSIAPAKPAASGRSRERPAYVSASGNESSTRASQASTEAGPAVSAAMAGKTRIPVPMTAPT